VRLERGDQVLIAAISCPTPKIVIHSLEVIGQDVEAHLGSDLVEGPGQDVGGAHPGLEGAKRVFDGLSSHAHGLGHAVEPILHPVEHVLILPALDTPQLGRRAPGFQPAGEAGAILAKASSISKRRSKRSRGEASPFYQTFGLAAFGMTRSGYIWDWRVDRNRAYPHDTFGRPALGGKPGEAMRRWFLQTTAADFARFLLSVLDGSGYGRKQLRRGSVLKSTFGWIRFADRIGQLAKAMRAVLAWRGPTGAVGNRAVSFGGTAAALLAGATGELAQAAALMRLPLGPVRVGWVSESRVLSERLAGLPMDVEGELAGSQRPSFRRATGIGVLYAIEALITLVLFTAVWRLGSGFVLGDYVSSGLLLNTTALLVVLLLLGQLAGNLLFLPLQERFRRTVAQRAQTIVEAHWRRAAVLLTEQLEAADRLEQQGRALLAEIDGIVGSLARAESGGADVVRLFGEQTTGPARRQPVFE